MIALAVCSTAWAHAHVSPSVVQAKQSEVFTLAVPTEKENANTTKIEFTPPAGFGIDSFIETPGWTRDVQSTGSGEDTVIQKVTWSGGSIPPESATNFQFLASTDASKSYDFKVRQFYSDGSVVDWTGPESSDTPAPIVEAKSDLGGGGSSTLEIIALIVAGAALVLALVALLTRSGGRNLT